MKCKIKQIAANEKSRLNFGQIRRVPCPIRFELISIGRAREIRAVEICRRINVKRGELKRGFDKYVPAVRNRKLITYRRRDFRSAPPRRTS